jgi:hypothetical protein
MGNGMAGKGFTVSILPHGGKPPRQYEFKGAKLALLRAGVLFFALLLAGALAIVITGTDALASASSQRLRIQDLEDSLLEARMVEARLDSVEAMLEQIDGARVRIESLATAIGPPPGDSL